MGKIIIGEGRRRAGQQQLCKLAVILVTDLLCYKYAPGRKQPIYFVRAPVSVPVNYYFKAAVGKRNGAAVVAGAKPNAQRKQRAAAQLDIGRIPLGREGQAVRVAKRQQLFAAARIDIKQP